MDPVNWGVISTADIGVKKVIPAMQTGEHCRIAAISSRDAARAQAAADELGIPKAYGSYEELLADPEIEAIYNPLPNHLHVEWTAKAAEAGKHVLCEKPLGMDAADAARLLEVRDRTGVMIQEAFMVRTNPQWLRARELVREGAIGELRAVDTLFSYYNVDAANVRNIADIGGGGLMDIGCYAITTSRFLFEDEPRRVVSLIERDPDFKTDRLTSGLMDFPNGHATFVVSTQLVPYQRSQILGTKGRIEVEIPFNAPPDRPNRIFIDDGNEAGGATGGNVRTETFDVADQYQIAGDAFSAAIRGQREQPIPLEDAIANMKVIDAVFRSAESGAWEEV